MPGMPGMPGYPPNGMPGYGPMGMQGVPQGYPGAPRPPVRAPTVPPVVIDQGLPKIDHAKLVVVHLDGTEQGEFPLQEGDNLIGREVGGLLGEDGLLSSRHATITLLKGQAVVRDESARNGTYVRIPKMSPVELHDGDQFCFGRIILRFESQNTGALPGEEGAPPLPPGEAVGQLALVVGRDVDRSLFPIALTHEGVTLGRSRADIRFPSDGWVSGVHCQVTTQNGAVVLVDRDSSNGTYLRIHGTHPLQNHDALLMGQRIFHIHIP